jgi:hypothetical protein
MRISRVAQDLRSLVAGLLVVTATPAFGQSSGTVVTPSEAIRTSLDGGVPSTRTLDTYYRSSFDQYFLQDVWNVAGAYCYDASSYSDAGSAAAWFAACVEPTCYTASSDTNTWSAGALAERASDFRNAERVLTLFRALYGREGADGNGERLVVLSGMPPGSAQAWPTWGAIALGRGDLTGGRPSDGVIDVAAHEFGHLVNWNAWEHSAGYFEGSLRGVRGTVDEHLADMFGVVAKFYLADDPWVDSVRWVHAAELRYGANYARRNDVDFIHSVIGDRNYYLATDGVATRAHVSQLYTGVADNGGVHFNALLLGRAFYLFTEGGIAGTAPDGTTLPGWPSNGPNLAVQGIGMERLAKLTYRVAGSTDLSTIAQVEQDATLMVAELKVYASLVHSTCLVMATEESWPTWVCESVKNGFAAVGLMEPSTNQPPIADAGPDQAIALVGSTVQLDGRESYDPEGDPITYQWSLVTRPAGSSATPFPAGSATPVFLADVNGPYVVRLVVSDGLQASTPDLVTVSFQNVKPVADAGLSQSTLVGDTVTLNGSASSDVNGDALTYQWSFASVPEGSRASIADPTAVTTTFAPDTAGTYILHLVVNDGFVNSDTSTVQITAVSRNTQLVDAVMRLEDLVSSLDAAAFKNSNMQNALLNKLNALIAQIWSGNFAGSLARVEHDVLEKTDGCATNGGPDKNDWITNCSDQARLRPAIQELIAMLRGV